MSKLDIVLLTGISGSGKSVALNALEDADWCAVQVMVERKDVIDVMDRLEAIGATAILQTDISNCRL